MKITYFGHSCFQIETEGTTILVDPFLEENPHTDTSADELDPDVVLLTHAHFDHTADAADVLTDNDALLVSNFEITQYYNNEHGHENFHPLNEGGKAEFDWGSVEGVHARHSSSFADGTYGGVAMGHIMHLGGKCLYNAGDTAPFVEMEWIGNDHDVDLAFFPIGDVFTMGIDGALRAAEMVKPQRILPVHYGTFPPIEIDLDEWETACTEAGFRAQSTRADEVFTI